MASHKVKVFGERNTGTTASVRMLNSMQDGCANFPKKTTTDQLDLLQKRIIEHTKGRSRRVMMDAVRDQQEFMSGGISAWKHTAPVFDDSFSAAGASVLFIVRNPYSWIVSFTRRPYHIQTHRKSVEDFVQTPWLTLKRDRVGTILLSPLHLWNEKLVAYRRFRQVADVKTAVMGFEGFVAEPVAELAEILAQFGIPDTGLAELDRSTKDNDLHIDEVKSRYRTEKWKSQLNRRTVELINGFVDWDIAESYGYSMLDPLDFPDRIPEPLPLRPNQPDNRKG